MAEKKVLYIGFKRQDGILIGGGLANKRCINTLNRRFGEQNVHEYYLLDETKGRSLWSYLLATILFLFDYHNGRYLCIVRGDCDFLDIYVHSHTPV